MARKQFPLAVVIEAVDKLSAPMRRINGRIKDATKPVRRLAQSFKTLARESGLTRVAGMIGNITKRLGIAAIAAAGLAAKLVFDFAKAGDNIAKTARAVGMGVQEFQRWQFVADRNGVSQGLFNSSLTAFSKRLGEAKAGTGGLFTMLNKVNPVLLQQLRTTSSVDEAFGLFMDNLAGVKDESLRAAIAASAFSRAGVKMANVAASGSEEIRRLKDRADELGLVLGDKAAADAEAFVDSWTDLKAAMTGARNVIGGALMPTLKALADQLTALVINNTPAIKEFGQRIAEMLTPENFAAARDVLFEIGGVFRDMGTAIAWVHEKVGIVKAAVIGFAAIVTATLLPAIIAIGTALAPVIVAAAPFLGIAAVIAGISAAVVFLIKKLVELAKRFDVVGKAKRKFESAVGGVKSFFGFDDAPDGPESSVTSETVNRGRSEVVIRGDFSGVPSGARVEMDAPRGADASLDVGYSMAGAY